MNLLISAQPVSKLPEPLQTSELDPIDKAPTLSTQQTWKYVKNGLAAASLAPLGGLYYICGWLTYVATIEAHMYSQHMAAHSSRLFSRNMADRSLALLAPAAGAYSMDSFDVSAALGLKLLSSLAVAIIHRTDLSGYTKLKLEQAINALGLGITSAAALSGLSSAISYDAPSALQLTALHSLLAVSFFRSLRSSETAPAKS